MSSKGRDLADAESPVGRQRREVVLSGPDISVGPIKVEDLEALAGCSSVEVPRRELGATSGYRAQTQAPSGERGPVWGVLTARTGAPPPPDPRGRTLG